MRFKNLMSDPNVWVFFLSLAIIFPSAFTLLVSFDFDTVVDVKDYFGLAQLDLDQSPYRKYRILIPFVAGAIDYLFGGVFDILSPWDFPGSDFSLGMSFLTVNSVLMALFCTYLFKLCLLYGGRNWLAAVMAVVMAATSRWTISTVGIPGIDGLWMLVIVMVLYGLKKKDARILIFTILIGPWAKESFLFFAPIIFFYAPINKTKQVGYFFASGVLVFGARYVHDLIVGVTFGASIQEDLGTLGWISDSLARLFSFHGIYDIFSVTGFWAIFFLALLQKKTRQAFAKQVELYHYWFLVSIVFQLLISAAIARMFYMVTPIYALMLVVIWNETQFFERLQKAAIAWLPQSTASAKND